MTVQPDERASSTLRNLSDGSSRVKRRGLIAGAAALVAGVIAKAAIAEETVSAATGSPLLLGSGNTPTNSTDTTYLYNPSLALSASVYEVSNFATTQPTLPPTSRIAVSGLTSAAGATGTGDSTATLIGVYGGSDKGYGVYGSSSSGPGVFGASDTNHGVSGYASGTGTTFITAELYGSSNTTYGIIGHTTAAGYSGLTGTTSTPGVAAMGGTATVPTAYAAYFTGKTVVSGDFYVVGGGKFAAVAHADGSYQGLYCTESPEPWFEDFGEGKFVNGRADVKLDPDFAALIHADSYHVFLTEHDTHHHLAVAQRTPSGFAVLADVEGAAARGMAVSAVAGTFSWRVVGKRKDIAGTRLPKVDLPKINHPDPAKLPPMPETKPPPDPLPTPARGGNPVNPSHKGNP